jgi:hypothetical protein
MTLTSTTIFYWTPKYGLLNRVSFIIVPIEVGPATERFLATSWEGASKDEDSGIVRRLDDADLRCGASCWSGLLERFLSSSRHGIATLGIKRRCLLVLKLRADVMMRSLNTTIFDVGLVAVVHFYIENTTLGLACVTMHHGQQDIYLYLLCSPGLYNENRVSWVLAEVHGMLEGADQLGRQQRVVSFSLALLIEPICMAHTSCVCRCEKPVKVVVCRGTRHSKLPMKD